MSEFRNLLISKKQGGGVEQWMLDAVAEYGIPLKNLQKAYELLPDVQWCFKEGKKCVIVSTGTQVVKTDYFPNLNTDIYISYKCTNYPAFIMGSYSDPEKSLTLYSGAYMNTQRFGNTRIDILSSRLRGTHKVRINKYGILIDEEEIIKYLGESTSFISKTPLYLFTASQSNEYGYSSSCNKGYIESCVIMENDNIVRYIVPSNNGMFDLIQGKFYPNAGTGKFTIDVLDD